VNSASEKPSSMIAPSSWNATPSAEVHHRPVGRADFERWHFTSVRRRCHRRRIGSTIARATMSYQ
jgi:hypothetical protein